MAVNTKIDLYDGKVEQCSTELLHLSGCTHVYGEFLIQSGGTISILDNAGTGKVFTSDGLGNGTWEINLGGIINASNGLTRIGGTDVVWGGSLTGVTRINTDGGALYITGNTSNFGIYLDSNYPVIGFGDYSAPAPRTYISITPSITESLQSDGSNSYTDVCQLAGVLQLSANDCINNDYSCYYQTPINISLSSTCGSIGTYSTLNICNGIMTIDGYSTTGFSGIQYVGDYSATYTPRSLPDVAWVTGHSLTASNGLTISGTTVYLGGALSQNTTINAFGHAFKICGLNNCDLLTIDDSVGIISLCTGGGAYICLESGDYIGLYASAEGLSINGTGSTKFTSINGTGIVYAGDYSATFCDNSLVSKLYVDNALTGSTSTAGQNITKLICQTSHGFNVGDVLGWSGGTYNKAIASGAYDGEVLGLVSKCYNVDCFDLTQAGYVTGLTGLITSTTYFLSDVTAGQLASTEPIGNTHISKAVIIANSSTSGWILPYAGVVISTGTTIGIVNACNGLTTDGTTVCLGGVLSQNTNINISSYYLRITGGTCYMGLDVQESNVSIGNYNSLGRNYVYTYDGATGIYQSDGTNFSQLDAYPGFLVICAANPASCINNCITIGENCGICLNVGDTFTSLNSNIYLLPESICIKASHNLGMEFRGTGIVTDNTLATPLGLQYASDYSANFVDRSLVDKGYVIAQISGGSSLSVFTITGNSTATGFTVNHAKNKQFVAVEVVRGSSPYDTVYTSVQRPNVNCVCVTFDTAPANGQQFKILITS
jgi:hypothetical protein